MIAPSTDGASESPQKKNTLYAKTPMVPTSAALMTLVLLIRVRRRRRIGRMTTRTAAPPPKRSAAAASCGIDSTTTFELAKALPKNIMVTSKLRWGGHVAPVLRQPRRAHRITPALASLLLMTGTAPRP